MIKYRSELSFSILAILAELVVTEVVLWIDKTVPEKFNFFRIVKFLLAAYLVVTLTLKNLRQVALLYKLLLAGFLFTRTALCITELYLVRYTDALPAEFRDNRVHQLYSNVMIITQNSSTWMVTNGIFSFKECLVFNLVNLGLMLFIELFFRLPAWDSHVFMSLVVTAYNIIDSRRIADTEMKSFLRIIKVNKQSAYLSKFVDRLLPKHVESA